MSDMTEIRRLAEQQIDAFAEFKARHERDLNALAKEVCALKADAQRPRFSDRGAGPAPQSIALPAWYDAKSHRPVRVLGPADSFAAGIERRSDEPDVSIGRVLRGLVVGAAADDARELAEERKSLSIGEDPGGGYTVSGRLAAQWIDLLRSAMVLNRAGVTTLGMDSKTLTIAKLASDPSVAWHAENAALSDSDPTFGAVELQARTVVGLVKLSLELSQDSANIEQMLQRSLTEATAAAIDSAGLQGTATNSALAPRGLLNFSGINALSSVGAPTTWGWVVDAMYELMLDNVPMDRIGALVAHPAVWKKMRELATGISSDNTPLTAPAEVAALPKLWTTAAPLSGGNATAVIGDWRDLLFGVRADITIRVLRESFLGSNLQVGVLVVARCDFVPAREASFCSCPGITV